MNKEQPQDLLKALSDEQLQQEVARRRTFSRIYVVIIVSMMCFAVYNATHKGSFIFSIMPLFFLPVFVRIQKNYKEARAEQQSRGL